MLKCNQICPWNYSCLGVGCKKPDDELCPMSNVGAQQTPKTNADRIRAMTDEELAKCLYEIGFDCHLCSEHDRLSDNPFLRHEKCDEKCTEHCLKWLQQPAEGE